MEWQYLSHVMSREMQAVDMKYTHVGSSLPVSALSFSC